MKQTRGKPYFQVGQRVVCVDASPNRRSAAKVLTRGAIYTIRAIDETPGWRPVGWGVHLDGIWIFYPDDGAAWPFDPRRFRPVIARKTDISVFTAMLGGKPRKRRAPVQIGLPLPMPGELPLVPPPGGRRE